VTVPYTAFSYSRLNNFEQCPKKFYAISIAKTFKEEESEAMTYGSAVHKALELRVARGTPLPGHLTHLEPVVAPLAASPGTKKAEFQMAINGSMEPVSWFGKDVYCRAIADLVVDRGTKAALFDYKTGKKSDDFMQLKLTGSLYFQHAPAVQQITLAFIWTKDKTITKTVIERDEMGELWSALMPRVDRYQEAFRTMDFPPRPGRHCRWCPVKSCPSWGT
jgi:RecB family exonuclease